MGPEGAGCADEWRAVACGGSPPPVAALGGLQCVSCVSPLTPVARAVLLAALVQWGLGGMARRRQHMFQVASAGEAPATGPHRRYKLESTWRSEGPNPQRVPAMGLEWVGRGG